MDDLLQTLGLSRNNAPEDNAVCYALYPGVGSCTTDEELGALATDCLTALFPYIKGYIWQRDAFTLATSTAHTPPWDRGRRNAGGSRRQGASAAASATAAGDDGPPCVWGTVAFGDNVEDEWFVTWLVLELTRRFPGLSARVWDDDGEFLLIEAAYHLPRWLKPEVGVGRVWLHGGRLHVVPLPSARHPTLPPVPTAAEALAIVRSESVDTRMPRVEAAVMRRLPAYPEAARANTHRARVVMPRRAAVVVKGEPQLIGAAVEAFYYRDAGDTRAAARMRRFPPRDMVAALVPMTRCMYAQLTQQQYAPPKGCAYPMPPPADVAFKAFDLGLKITAGLEMVCARGQKHCGAAEGDQQQQQQQQQVEQQQPQQQQQQQQQQQSGAASKVAVALEDDPGWRAYLARLEGSGYFQGNISGSAKHKQLLAAAREVYAGSAAYKAAASHLAAPAARAAELLAAAGEPWEPALPPPPPAAAGAAVAAAGAAVAAAGAAAGVAAAAAGGVSWAAAGAPPFFGDPDEEALPEDDDSWMRLQAEELERQMQAREAEAERHQQRKAERSKAREQQPQHQKRAGQSAGTRDGGGAVAMEVDAAEIAGQVRGFLKHLSSHEGAEVPPERGGRGASAAGGGGGGGVRFDARGFLAELSAALGESAGGGDGDGGAQQRSGGGGGAAGPSAEMGLESLLRGLQAAAASAGLDAGAAGDDDDEDEEGWSSSEEEGSSFFGSGSSEPGSEEGSEEEGGPTVTEAEAPASGGRAGNGGGTSGTRKPEADAAPAPAEYRLPPSVAASSGAAPLGSSGAPLTGAARASSAAGGRRGAGADGAVPLRLAQLQELWEVRTATDSDDDDDDERGSGCARRGGGAGDDDDELSIGGDDSEFLDAYAEALEDELAGTKLAESFERAGDPDGSADGSAGGGGCGLRPVDLDLNLVKGLMASYGSQGGLPGPASNLAGLLGLTLPTEEEAAGASSAGGGGAAK